MGAFDFCDVCGSRLRTMFCERCRDAELYLGKLDRNVDGHSFDLGLWIKDLIRTQVAAAINDHVENTHNDA